MYEGSAVKWCIAIPFEVADVNVAYFKIEYTKICNFYLRSIFLLVFLKH